MSMELFVSLRYLHGRKMGFVTIITILSIIGVILGTFVLIGALSVSNGFENEVRDRIVGTFAHGRIMQYHSRPIRNGDSLMTEILSHPEVTHVAPLIMGKGAVEHDALQEGVQVMAIDDSLEPGVSDLHTKLIDGEFSLDSLESARGRKQPAIIIGSGLAKKFGVRAGMEIVLMSIVQEDGAFDPTPKMMRFAISAVFETGMYEYDQALVFISIPSGQKMYAMRGAIEGISFRCRDMYDVQDVARGLVEQLGGYPYKYSDWMTQNKSLFQWMKLEKLVILLFLSIIVLVAAFNIMATRIMIIMEKRREIGILMGMGAHKINIVRIFLSNGLVIGLIGSTIGTILGLVICGIQQQYQVFPLPGDVYFIDFLPVLVKPWDVIWVFLGTNLLCTAATIYPAWSASKLLPAQAIRLD